MRYVKIKVVERGHTEDLLRWQEHMLEKAKCWNKFCLGLYGEYELRAVYVVKEGHVDNNFLTTLCEDCIKNTTDYGVLVAERHLTLDSHQKK